MAGLVGMLVPLWVAYQAGTAILSVIPPEVWWAKLLTGGVLLYVAGVFVAGASLFLGICAATVVFLMLESSL